MLYLNSGYSRKNDKGCLEIWNDEMDCCLHEIEPLCNRLVFFRNSDTSYHGVPTVLSRRIAITWSIMSKLKHQGSDRNKAFFIARPEDDDEINILGLERSKIKDTEKK